jgi:hypothetical protein
MFLLIPQLALAKAWPAVLISNEGRSYFHVSNYRPKEMPHAAIAHQPDEDQRTQSYQREEIPGRLNQITIEQTARYFPRQMRSHIC